ncbi:hypothetical protein KC19_11G009300 [Ceratodon purpureus]|uniref:Uncharacterized protein n=1 Tax=Ceratodon purpureus TaxID=3225 RepID=A0A8T0G976_CERPU|nr:hypothetical protein KC19_11G009300 [Ceratodon purpureus]
MLIVHFETMIVVQFAAVIYELGMPNFGSPHAQSFYILQLYPVSLLGGIQYVKMLKLLFRSLPIIPANGISLGEYRICGISRVLCLVSDFQLSAYALEVWKINSVL